MTAGRRYRSTCRPGPVEVADIHPGRCTTCGDPLAWVGEPGSARIHAWSGRLGLPHRPYDHPATCPQPEESPL
ncbi:hypothetical protein Pa4123_24160 [Phytohabitans aurantiacus]|uniref:Uncharacterized protein n=1 Tax=Phytohabitans aurantiacus TaxID=3016789 RepID=A0ABQ5QTA2_9ACTN|nr:hypothetical protein Pa4123_24160 [Phytohabitans aurantiacus]